MITEKASNNNTSVFDQYARTYNEGLKEAIKVSGFEPDYFHEYKPKEMRRLLGDDYSNGNLNILDFGCGGGFSDRFLRKYFPNSQIFGCDVSKESLSVARENNGADSNCHYAVYGLEQIPFNERFDLIFAAGVFHHIPRDQQLKTLKLLRSTLKLNGRLFVFELNPLNPLTLWVAIQNDYKFDKNSRLLSPRYAKNLFEQAGFLNAKTRFTVFFPAFLKSLIPLEKHLHALPLGAHYYFIAENK